MTRCAEGDALRSLGRIRSAGVISRDQLWDIGQLRGTGRFAGVWVDSHLRPA